MTEAKSLNRVTKLPSLGSLASCLKGGTESSDTETATVGYHVGSRVQCSGERPTTEGLGWEEWLGRRKDEKVKEKNAAENTTINPVERGPGG